MTMPVRVGEIIAGRYRVERVLGQGGMGVVVAAQHVHLDEPVAIKFPLPRAMLRKDLVARAIREGRAAAKLKGEHVARVIDVGTLDTGEPFLVLELLRGSDLGVVLDAKGRLPVDDALEYVLQACEALAEAHALGIVHRDLKPGNLFVTRRPDGSRSIKVIDFGIAKAAEADGADAPVATESHVVLGTPLYMSPEQMRSAKDVDGRSDVWSLGAVLHHLLAGAPPFPPLSLPEIYQLALAGAPRIREARPEVPEAIEAALLRCMAKDRSDRFADVAELAEALAPHAPPRARVSAERARRILASGAAEGSVDSGDLPEARRPKPLAAGDAPETLIAAQPGSPSPGSRAVEAGGEASIAGLAPTLAAPEHRPSLPDPAEISPRPARSVVVEGTSEPASVVISAPRAGKRPLVIATAGLALASAIATAWLLGREAATIPPAPGATTALGSASVTAPPREPPPSAPEPPRPEPSRSTLVTPAAPVPTASASAGVAAPSTSSRPATAPRAAPSPAVVPGPLDDPN